MFILGINVRGFYSGNSDEPGILLYCLTETGKLGYRRYSGKGYQLLLHRTIVD